MRSLPIAWYDPPWGAAFDADRLMRLVPTHATMTGQFLAAVAAVAEDRGIRLLSARQRYTPFSAYPLREHCELLLETARKVFPELPLREGLRKLGRGAPHVLLQSVVGRVVFGSVDGPLEVLRAMATSYMLHMRPGKVEVLAVDATTAVVQASEIYNFLDSHNVGVFEGAMRHAGVRGDVRIHAYDRSTADLRCSWGKK
jgi:uncharacterized protein (TIGR02265 family)